MPRPWFKRRYRDYEIEPDQIFLDDANLSNLDRQQFEGVIESPIRNRSLLALGGFFVLVFLLFLGRLVVLQIADGQDFFAQSENNRLRQVPLFAERGIIYDRNNVEIAWNTRPNEGDDATFSYRAYTPLSGHGHLLGYVSYPQKDSSGNFWRYALEGQAGLEKKYNDLLAGVNGAELIETDAGL
ncbi:hypothetical protein KC929_02160, partial [Patescibacteria group bacterium]|nr:hypothetical protein [Patescibacteria group bacterium]